MGVEEVHIVEPHALQTLVQTGHQRLARAPIAVRSGPHHIAGLGTDEEFVAIGGEIGVEQAAYRFLGGSGRRAVVVGQVEMGDAMVKGITADSPTLVKGHIGTKILPKPQTYLGQHDATAPTAGIGHAVIVAIRGGEVFVHRAEGIDTATKIIRAHHVEAVCVEKADIMPLREKMGIGGRGNPIFLS